MVAAVRVEKTRPSLKLTNAMEKIVRANKFIGVLFMALDLAVAIPAIAAEQSQLLGG